MKEIEVREILSYQRNEYQSIVSIWGELTEYELLEIIKEIQPKNKKITIETVQKVLKEVVGSILETMANHDRDYDNQRKF